ncbi:MAG: DUF1824 family protein [Leptolyngbyaceae cyanobacterium CSU_1_4]|nr:DUF1824 family protein [Leptolyngbyaceae cyanobacterium CSU_1_4]
MSFSTPLTLETAHRILQQFSAQRLDFEKPTDTVSVQEALLWVAAHSDYQILGVCADSLEEGIRALEGYARALNYSPNLDLEPMEGSVYIKFNPNSKCYASLYDGKHRGVLVSCQSADATDVNEMYGHLPLDLFEQESHSSNRIAIDT